MSPGGTFCPTLRQKYVKVPRLVRYVKTTLYDVYRNIDGCLYTICWSYDNHPFFQRFARTFGYLELSELLGNKMFR